MNLEKVSLVPPREDRGGVKFLVGIAAISSIGHLYSILTTDFSDLYDSQGSDAKSYFILTFIGSIFAFFLGVHEIQKGNALKNSEILLAQSYLLRSANICERAYALTCSPEPEEELFVCWCFDLEDALNAHRIIRRAYSREFDDCIRRPQIYDSAGKRCLDEYGKPFPWAK